MADAVENPHEAARPDPAEVESPAEFVEAMRRLQRWADLSYREVEKRARDAGNQLPRSTLTAALARTTLPREGIVEAFVQACDGDQEEVQRWLAARRRIASAPDPDSNGAGAGTPATGPTPRSWPGIGRPGWLFHRTTGVLVTVLAVTALAVIVGRALLAPTETNPAGGTAGNAAEDAGAVPSTVTQGTPLGRNQPCPHGWFCLYEHALFNGDRPGRMLKFQDDYWQPLREWDFDNHASSVRNLLGRDACLSADWPVGASKLRIPAGTGPTTLSPDWDNQASGIKLGPC